MYYSKLFYKYFNAKSIYIFLVIVIVYFVALTLEFNFVFTDNFYVENIQKTDKHASQESISAFIIQDRATEWVNYPMVFLIVLFPAVLIGFALLIGGILKGYHYRYHDYFSVALKAQLVFALNYFIAVLLKWQKLIDRNLYNVNNNFDYQSLLRFVNFKELAPEFYYPLQSINIAEGIHILFLSFGMYYLLKIRYLKALIFTILFYGAALFFWIVFTVFLQVTLY